MNKKYKIKKFKPSVPSPLLCHCPYCGKIPSFDYIVSSEIWYKIIPKKYKCGVVCLRCFDKLAQEKKIDWIPHFKSMFFANNKVSIRFKIKEIYFDALNKKEEWIE